eukprot:Rmarinus@m.19372
MRPEKPRTHSTNAQAQLRSFLGVDRRATVPDAPEDEPDRNIPITRTSSDGSVEVDADIEPAAVHPATTAESMEDELNLIPDDYKEETYNPIPRVYRLLASDADDLATLEATQKSLDERWLEVMDKQYHGFKFAMGAYSRIIRNITQTQNHITTLRTQLLQLRSQVAQGKDDLRVQYGKSIQYTEALKLLDQIETLMRVPETARELMASKHYIHVARMVIGATASLDTPALESVGALRDVRANIKIITNELYNQLLDDLHSHLYLKTPRAWPDGRRDEATSSSWKEERKAFRHSGAISSGAHRDSLPFVDAEDPLLLTEDLSSSPERKPELFLCNLVSALGVLGKCEAAASEVLKRLTLEIDTVIDDTVNEVSSKYEFALMTGHTGSDSSSRGVSALPGRHAPALSMLGTPGMPVLDGTVVGASSSSGFLTSSIGAHGGRSSSEPVVALLRALFEKLHIILDKHVYTADRMDRVEDDLLAASRHCHVSRAPKVIGAIHDKKQSYSVRTVWNTMVNEVKGLLGLHFNVVKQLDTSLDLSLDLTLPAATPSPLPSTPAPTVTPSTAEAAARGGKTPAFQESAVPRGTPGNSVKGGSASSLPGLKHNNLAIKFVFSSCAGVPPDAFNFGFVSSGERGKPGSTSDEGQATTPSVFDPSPYHLKDAFAIVKKFHEDGLATVSLIPRARGEDDVSEESLSVFLDTSVRTGLLPRLRDDIRQRLAPALIGSGFSGRVGTLSGATVASLSRHGGGATPFGVIGGGGAGQERTLLQAVVIGVTIARELCSLLLHLPQYANELGSLLCQVVQRLCEEGAIRLGEAAGRGFSVLVLDRKVAAKRAVADPEVLYATPPAATPVLLDRVDSGASLPLASSAAAAAAALAATGDSSAEAASSASAVTGGSTLFQIFLESEDWQRARADPETQGQSSGETSTSASRASNRFTSGECPSPDQGKVPIQSTAVFEAERGVLQPEWSTKGLTREELIFDSSHLCNIASLAESLEWVEKSVRQMHDEISASMLISGSLKRKSKIWARAASRRSSASSAGGDGGEKAPSGPAPEERKPSFPTGVPKEALSNMGSRRTRPKKVSSSEGASSASMSSSPLLACKQARRPSDDLSDSSTDIPSAKERAWRNDTRDLLKNLCKIAEECRNLAAKCLFILRLEVRAHAYCLLHGVTESSYMLSEEPTEPDQCVINLNKDLDRINQSLASVLSRPKRRYVFDGVARHVCAIFIQSHQYIQEINENGKLKMCRNVYSLQQNLGNIMDTTDVYLDRVRAYYENLMVSRQSTARLS